MTKHIYSFKVKKLALKKAISSQAMTAVVLVVHLTRTKLHWGTLTVHRLMDKSNGV